MCVAPAPPSSFRVNLCADNSDTADDSAAATVVKPSPFRFGVIIISVVRAVVICLRFWRACISCQRVSNKTPHHHGHGARATYSSILRIRPVDRTVCHIKHRAPAASIRLPSCGLALLDRLRRRVSYRAARGLRACVVVIANRSIDFVCVCAVRSVGAVSINRACSSSRA